MDITVKELEMWIDSNYGDTTIDEIITGFRGECADDYSSTYEYVINGGWEKDYFASWMEGCAEYPTLREIMYFCKYTDAMIMAWINSVEG